MIKTKLYTESGGFVADVEVPPFITGAPPILIWGQRFFKFTEETSEGYKYNEAFTYAVPPEIK